MRGPNPVDFWRGFALVNILVCHIPDNGFWRFTLRQFSWSDGAEILIFLSGWVLARRVASPSSQSLVGLAPRLAKIYVAQVVVTFILLFLFLKAQAHGDLTILRDNRFDVLQFGGMAVFGGVVSLMQHVLFFDILPLYFVLTLLIPVFILLARVSPLALLAFSAAYYLLAQFGLTITQWPSGRPFAFNPFAWQFVFVIGIVAGHYRTRIAEGLMRAPFAAPAAILITLLALVCMRLGVPHPDVQGRTGLEAILWDKGNAGVMRLVQFAALVVVAWLLSPAIARLLPLPWRMGSLLGRNSLVVFCALGVLAAIGQIAHRQGHHGIVFDTLYTSAAIAMMLACALARDFLRNRPAPSAASANSAGASAAR